MKTTYAIILIAIVLFAAKELLKKSPPVFLPSATSTPLAVQTAPVPEPPKEIKVVYLDTPQMLKGLYVTFYSFESKTKFNEIIAAAEKNGINALIIDVRSDGTALFDFSDYNAKYTFSQLHDKGIYLIARVVAFKVSDTKWYDPSSKERWNQIADISKRAIDLGFDEINYDYIRYGGPSEARSDTPIAEREPIIKSFFEFLNKEVRQKYGRPISADIFGITFINADAGIGQSLEDAAQNFDYIMPMPYPSHWALGSLGIAHPGNQPYQIVYQSLTKGWIKIKDDPLRVAQLRSWIQAFDIESISPWKLRPYTAVDIQDQIKACTDAGCVGWSLWNGFSTYKDFANATSSVILTPISTSTSTSTVNGVSQ
jgi:hypothetical protein